MTQDPSFVRKRAPALLAIITLKSVKAVLLLSLAVGFFSLIGQDLHRQFDDMLRYIHVDPERHFFADLGLQLQKITPTNLRWAASGSLLYSLLLIVESAGLISRSWWSVWLAIGETAFFIPIEVFDLADHFSWIVTIILVLNIFIVTYLVRNRDRLFRHHHPHAGGGGPAGHANPKI
jgi:uncharacterized membrane protein (DUF2068 family)